MHSSCSFSLARPPFNIVAVVAAGSVVVIVAVFVFDDGGSDLPCGLKLDAPEGWGEEEVGDNYIVYASSLESEDDKFRENVNVMIQNVTGMFMTLDDFLEFSFDEMTGEVVLESGETTLDGLDAQRMIYTTDLFGSGLKFLQVFTMAGNSVYMVTYTATEESFDKYLGVAEEFIDSIEIRGDCYSVDGEPAISDEDDDVIVGGEGGPLKITVNDFEIRYLDSLERIYVIMNVSVENPTSSDINNIHDKFSLIDLHPCNRYGCGNISDNYLPISIWGKDYCISDPREGGDSLSTDLGAGEEDEGILLCILADKPVDNPLKNIEDLYLFYDDGTEIEKGYYDKLNKYSPGMEKFGKIKVSLSNMGPLEDRLNVEGKIWGRMLV